MLRTRLLLNLIPFLLVLLAVGGYAIYLFSSLAKTVEGTVMDNYQSAAAAQAMIVAVSRMETGLQLVALEGQKRAGANMFNQNARSFESNLALLVKNAESLSQDTRPIKQLQGNYREFLESGNAILNEDRQSVQKQMYERGNVHINITTLTFLLERIRKVNHGNIVATSQSIQEIDRRITRLMGIALGVSFIICVAASLRLGRSVLGPIQTLTVAAREIGQGNLEQTVPVLSKDELGEMANAFNKMAGQLKAYRQSTSEKIVRLHHALESTLASFPDPIFVLNKEGEIELKNPAGEDLISQLGLQKTLPTRLAETASEVLRTGRDFLPHSFKEVVSFQGNGAEHFYLPRILAMHGEEPHENSKPVGVAVVLYDVTRFRLLDDAKTNLVATVSHELKSPLTSVRMVLHLLLEKTLGPLTRKQDEMLQTARKDAERLLRILNDLLDLTRLEAGKSGLNKERVNPADLIKTISEEVQQRINQGGLKLTWSTDPNLPPVLVDRQRIGHVFHNFITNAIKHSPERGEIKLSAVNTVNGGIRFSVRDQGPGVPEEYQSRIFDRFFRVPGQAKSGAGLGLSIAREIVVAHGGRIGVRSQPSQGSEFYMVLSSADEELPENVIF